MYLEELKEMRKRLVRYWKFLGFNYEKLRIYKGNPGINRGNEMLLYRAQEDITNAKLKVDMVIQDIDKKIKVEQEIYDLWNNSLIKQIRVKK